MIRLSSSIYIVYYNAATFEHHVYIRSHTGIQEITDSMNDTEKEELISDLIFEIYDNTTQKNNIRKGIKMIALQGSRFGISYDEHTGNYKIYVYENGYFHDITRTITNDEVEELLNDLIYCVHSMVTYCEVI